jgi:CRP/FNR family transcriptional regulator
MISKNELVKIFNQFSKWPESQIDEVISSSSLIHLDKGTNIYSEGDPCSGIGFFLSAEARVFKISETGREVTLYEIFPGQTCILNASSILSSRSYPANAVVTGSGNILFMPDKYFRGFISTSEGMRTFVFSLFNERFTEIMELIDEIIFQKLDVRLENYLIEKSENNELRTTHQAIANDLGTSREVISRLLKDMEKKEKISLSRHYIQLLNL